MTRVILHVVEATFAGVGRHVLDLALAQASDANNEVHVAYSPIRESESFARERSAATDVHWHEISMGRLPSLADTKALRALRRLVFEVEPDVIHGHSTKGGLLARLVPRSTNAIVLYTPNAPFSMNPGLHPVARRAIGRAEALLAKRTMAIIAVSPEESEHLEALGINPNRIALVPNGIQPSEDPSRQEARSALGVKQDALVMGFVGRLDSQKSPMRLIETFEALAPEEPLLELAVVGDGELFADLDARRLRLDADTRPRVHLLGERPGRASMPAFDLFFLPSDYEGFPYVLIEAAQCGLPLVASPGACARQLITSDAHGQVAPDTDIDSLCSAVRIVLANLHDGCDELRRKNGARFSISNMNAGVADVIEGLLAARADTQPQSDKARRR